MLKRIPAKPASQSELTPEERDRIALMAHYNHGKAFGLSDQDAKARAAYRVLRTHGIEQGRAAQLAAAICTMPLTA